jgi:hypothetical protein
MLLRLSKFSLVALRDPSKDSFHDLSRGFIHLRGPDLSAGDQPALKGLSQRLSYKVRLNRGFSYYVENRCQRPSESKPLRDLYINVSKIGIV